MDEDSLVMPRRLYRLTPEQAGCCAALPESVKPSPATTDFLPRRRLEVGRGLAVEFVMAGGGLGDG
jgi:hypothetical protein